MDTGIIKIEQHAGAAVLRHALNHYTFGAKQEMPSIEKLGLTYLSRLFALHGLEPQAASLFETYFPQHQLTPYLAARRLEIAANNLQLEELTEKVRRTLLQRSIPVQVLKGIPLAKNFYVSLADRLVGDIDILVKGSHCSEVDTVLRDLGFAPNLALTSDVRCFSADVLDPQEYISSSGTVIDVHYSSQVPMLFAPGSLAQLLRDTCSISGCLSDFDNFCFLCEHGTKHMWSRLIWLLDISLLLRSSTELEPRALLIAFDAAGKGRALRLLLSLLSLYTILPEKYEELKSDSGKSTIQLQRRHVQVNAAPEVIPRNLLMHLALLNNTAAKINYLRTRVFKVTQRDLRIALPSALNWLYPVARVFRLALVRVKRFLHPIYRSIARALGNFVLLIETLSFGLYSRAIVRYAGKAAARGSFYLNEIHPGNGSLASGHCLQETRSDTVLSIIDSIAKARKVLGRGTCFTEAYMLQLMLWRRRIPSKIIYGARQGERDRFVAHAWVEIEGMPVFGFDSEKNYIRFER